MHLAFLRSLPIVSLCPQDLIQAFSRTNRIFDDKKHFGHIITFQRPQAFKEAVDNALKLYPMAEKMRS